jgi:pimeloyl-[acyl-carrier protein] methyl ester esterase
VKLHVENAGRGPSLVLLHGWGLHSGVWAGVLPALTQHFRVSCIDLPGHGHSRGWDAGMGLEEVATAVGAVVPADAAWLGWSLGGQVAMAAAAAGLAKGRLVLVAVTPRFVTASDWPCAMAPATLAGFAAALAQDCGKTVRDFLTLQLRGDARAAQLPREMREVIRTRPEPEPAALSAGLGILADTDLRGRLAKLTQPTLVIAGERDRLVPAEAARRLAAGLPASELQLAPAAAHAPFMTDPAGFTAGVLEFLAHRGATL